MLIKGSGVFKDLCTSPTDAETKAIVNAVHVLLKTNFDFNGIKKIIINRDNIHAVAGRKGRPPQKLLTKLLKKLKDKCSNGVPPIVEYRHVKSHSNIKDKRSYVNYWCDSQCTMQLRNWKIKNNENK